MTRFVRSTVVFLLSYVLAAGLATSGQEGESRNLRFQTFPPGVQLTNDAVLSMLHDSKGFLWIGTQGGLNRWDGVTMRHYFWDKEDGAGVSYLHVVAEDARGDLWIGTHEGVFRFDRESETFHEAFPEGSEPRIHFSSLIADICFDDEGFMWVASFQGLARWHPETGDYHFFGPGPDDAFAFPESHLRILNLQFEGKERLWIGTMDGLLHLDLETRKFHRFNPAEVGLAIPETASIGGVAIGPDHRIWVATLGSGLFAFRPGERVATHFVSGTGDRSLNNDVVQGLVFDAKGILWATTDRGLCRIDPAREHVSRFVHDSQRTGSIGDNTLTKRPILIQDILWVGTRFAGLWWLDLKEGPFSAHRSPGASTGEPSIVSSFLPMDTDHTLVATDGQGVHQVNLKTGESQIYASEALPWSLPSLKTLALAQDHHGRIWIGTWFGGLLRFDPDTGERRQYLPEPENPSSVSDRNIFHLMVSRDGTLWIATWSQGLCRYDEETDSFVRYPEGYQNGHSLVASPITHLFEDSRGFIWVSSEIGGVSRLDPKTGEVFTFGQEAGKAILSTNSINCVAESPEGWILAGTNAGGLNVIDPVRMNLVDHPLHRALHRANVLGILFDASGNWWVSTSSGVSRYDPGSSAIRHYTREDGLHDNRMGRWAFGKHSDGSLLFGGTRGFTRVDPGMVRPQELPAPPVITSVVGRWDHEERPFSPTTAVLGAHKKGAEATIMPKQVRSVEFEFTSPEFRNPDRIRFDYRLKGVDSEWQSAHGARKAHYRNLTWGNYTFEVRAGTHEGMLQEQVATYPFRIATPLIHQWYSRLAMAVSLVLLAVGIVRLQIRRLELSKRKLELRVARRTRDLDASNQLLREKQALIEEQNRVLIHLNKSKDRMFSVFAHDIRNPFNSILSVSELLETRYHELSEEERVDHARFLMHTSRDVYSMLENLLYWSVSRKGSLPYNPDWIPMDAALEPTLHLYRAIANQQGVALEWQFPEDDTLIWADAPLLIMAVRNLISNAIRYSPSQGTTRLSVQKCPAGWDWIVRDQGKGLPEHWKTWLNGYSEANALQPEPGDAEGTGIGLSLCREIVRMHGGSIVSEQTPDDEHQIRFTLPEPQDA